MPIGTLDAISLPKLLIPPASAALAGVNTPLGGLAIDGADAAHITVILAVQSGRLYADPGPGATVSGGGSGAIWIAGTIGQVNAKLATLVYGSSLAGSDTLSLSLLDASGQVASGVVALDVIPTLVAAPSPDIIKLVAGAVTLESRTVDGVNIALAHPVGGGSASLVLINAVLGSSSTVNVSNAAGTAAASPRIAMAGVVELEGSVRFGAGPATVSVALRSVLINDGSIAFIGSDALLSGPGTFTNDGAIDILGGRPTIATAVTGTGTITLRSGATLTLGDAVAPDQTIDLQGGGNTLDLATPGSMQGTIAGMTATDHIMLHTVAADAASYRALDAGHGILTLYEGAQTIASLHLAGAFQPGGVIVSQSGTSLEISLADPQRAESSRLDSVDVYRFFSTTLGTELLTQDPSERDAIQASRPDLVYEGVAMRAVAPGASGAADAVAVYRFFDTAHGTHFLTASGSERDLILATRPDLVSEPASTFYEHPSPEAGDAPVFRFFDTVFGTHFYTADAGERATILSTRADLKDEGIAFYAPTV